MGCSSSGRLVWKGYESGWRQQVAARGIDPDTVVYPFRVTPEMAEWARLADPPHSGALARLQRLQQALFDPHEFTFEYDGDLTLTAEQAFELRRGNCLAFTSLFVALTRSVGLRTFLVSVKRVIDVTKEENLVVINRHVVAGYAQAGKVYLFDFYLASNAPFAAHMLVDEVGSSALYHVNMGSVALKQGDVDSALENLELAATLAPKLSSAWVNLGVARRRARDVDGAMEAYQRALEARPGDPSALTNLAYIYTLRGMDDRARAALVAASEGASSPFSLIALAEAEEVRGRFMQAKKHLLRARRSYRRVPEVWDALAGFVSRRGDERAAKRYRERADRLRRRAAKTNS